MVVEDFSKTLFLHGVELVTDKVLGIYSRKEAFPCRVRKCPPVLTYLSLLSLVPEIILWLLVMAPFSGTQSSRYTNPSLAGIWGGRCLLP